MLVSIDNTLVFSILDQFDKLPVSFKRDSVYSFEEDGSFYLVIFFASAQANRFLLFTIVRFKHNFSELNEISNYLLNMNIKDDRSKVVEDALDEVNAMIANGGPAETRYFDAH